MIVAVHQPQYLPWLGYFDKMIQADVFCFLDDVQYKKNEWQNRNRIKTAQGWQWLTVPVRYRFGQKINTVEINPAVDWRKKHWQAIKVNYGRAPFFEAYRPIFEEVFSRNWRYLSALNVHLVERLRKILQPDAKPAVLSSTLQLRQEPTERLIDICRTLGADTYLAGQGGADYMDFEKFKQSGIRVIIQAFKHPVYRQLYHDFQSHLSIIDLLFNCGPQSRNKITEANQDKG